MREKLTESKNSNSQLTKNRIKIKNTNLALNNGPRAICYDSDDHSTTCRNRVENRHMANVMRHSIYILTIIITTLTKHVIDTIILGGR